MKLVKRKESGYALAVIMFVLALWIPVSLIQGYLKNAHMIKNLTNQIRDTNLKWITESVANRSMYELKSQIQNLGLDACRFCPPHAINPECDSSNPAGGDGCRITEIETEIAGVNDEFDEDGWFNRPDTGFKGAFENFLGTGSAYLARAANEAEIQKLSLRVLENSAPASGVAVFDIGVRVALSDQLANLTSGMNQQFRIKSSNIASFSVFLSEGKDFAVSPGTDTTYEGPIYVGGNAHLTPNKGTTLTLACPDCDPADSQSDPNIYALKTRGSIMWGPPIKTGHNGEGVQGNSSKPYEADIFGNPVRYQFLSNIDPGWTGFDGIDGIQGAEAQKTSVIRVVDNHGSLADPKFTQLIGMVNSSDPLNLQPERAPLKRIDFLRGPDLAVPTTSTYTPISDINPPVPPAGLSSEVVMSSSFAYDPLNPALAAPFTDDLFMNFENPEWRDFLTDHFSVSTEVYFLQDKAASKTLQIGSEDPRDLIRFADELDNSVLRKVKFQWVAFNAQRYENGGLINLTTSDFSGISLDFRKYNCSGAACTDTTVIKGENPSNWDRANNATLGFLDFKSEGSSAFFYQDWRRIQQTYNANPALQITAAQANLKIIEVDVSKLSSLIVETPEVDHPFPKKPFVLYIGLDTDLSKPYHVLNTVIRIKNGALLPEKGLTIATNAFVQIQGNYNTDGTPPEYDESGELCDMIPAAVAGDQIMILSNSWQDWSAANTCPRTASDPTTFFNPFPCAPTPYAEGPAGNQITYPAPDRNPDLTDIQPFHIYDFRSHPIRPVDAAGDVVTNAVLISGTIDNSLEPMENTSALARKFFNGNLVGFSSGQLALNASSPGGRFPLFRRMRLDNNLRSMAQTPTGPCPFPKGIYPEITLNTSNQTPPAGNDISNPSCVAADGTRLRSNNIANTRVQIIDYELNIAGVCGPSLSPCIIDLGPLGGHARTTEPAWPADEAAGPGGAGFLSGCASCRLTNPYEDGSDPDGPGGIPARGYDDLGDHVPLYIKVDENGRYKAPCKVDGNHLPGTLPCNDARVSNMIVVTPIEDAYLKLAVSGGVIDQVASDVVLDIEGAYSQIKPGKRFAAFSRSAYYGAPDNKALPIVNPTTSSMGCCLTSDTTVGCSLVCPGDCYIDYASDPDVNHFGPYCSTSTWCPGCVGNACGAECQEDEVLNPSSLTCIGTGGYQCPTGQLVNGYTLLGPGGVPCTTTCTSGSTSYPSNAPVNYPVIRYSKGGYTRQATNPLSNSKYDHMYLPAYTPKYNGGFENAIRFGEDWGKWNCVCAGSACSSCSPLSDAHKVTLRGAVHILWNSETLVKSKTSMTAPVAYWALNTYTAPERLFKFSSKLKKEACVPPAMPRATPENEDLNVRRF